VGAYPLDSRFGLSQGFDIYDDNYNRIHTENFSSLERLENISNLRKLKMVFKDGKPVNLTKDEGQTSFWKLYFK